MDKITPLIWTKIKDYFTKGYSHEIILHLLQEKYDCNISLRTFSRLMSARNLKRKNITESSMEEIALAILLEHEGSGINLGYRSMWKRLQRVYKLTVKQKTVMLLLRKLDPEGVEGRCKYNLKRRVYNVPGPNYLWHSDNYDKLKRFGFAIYGCIDGFTKKVMWIHVSTTNNDPAVIGYYYLQCIEKHGFLPAVLRTDNGTEATIMGTFQMVLRHEHDDENSGLNSYVKGKSTRNQRIEAFWRQFRQRMTDFYIQLFKKMESDNLLDASNPLHIDCLRYSFASLIQEDVLINVKEWNEHRIRKQNNRNIPCRIPDEVYKCPEVFNTYDYRKELNLDHVKKLYEYTTKPHVVSPDFKELADSILKKPSEPRCAEEAYNLYFRLLTAIQRIMK